MGGRNPIVAALFGSLTAADETFGDRADLELFELEERTLAQASPERLTEFRTARSCARQALKTLGLPASSIPVGADRAPVWPSGIVGSITHCRGYRAAVVAQREHLLALGVDAEPDAPLPFGVADTAFTAKEVRAIDGLAGDINWDRLLFSAKEAIFKMQTTLGSQVLIEITFVSADGGIETTSHGTEVQIEARWVAAQGLIVTSATARRLNTSRNFSS